MICEGPVDEAFLRAMIDAHHLPEFCIRHGADLGENKPGGIDAIGQLLKGIVGWVGFADITEILIVVDSDSVPADNFNKVCSQIQSAQIDIKYPVPTAPLLKAVGKPNLTIMLLPWIDEAGDLETLCLPVALKVVDQIADCVHTFATCVGADDWPLLRKRDALKLRAVLAAAHPANPFIGLGLVWRDAPHLIPLNDATFDRIVAFLKTY